MPARPVFKTPVFVSRRVARRELRLLPTEQTTGILIYFLAILSNRYQIGVHAVCAMSNHWHAVISDPLEAVADLTRDFHSFVARHLNAVHGETESLWNSAQTSHVRPETADDLMGRIVYTMANPCAAGLVLYGNRWPGLRGCFGDKPITVARPVGFLRDVEDENGDELWPETATLTFARPPGFEELGDKELITRIRRRVEEAEAEARAAVFADGRTFLGARAILRQRRCERARSREVRGGISPRVACRDKWRRIERLQANKIWLAEYEQSRDRFAAGERDVVFPFGTYQMRIRHDVRVAPG